MAIEHASPGEIVDIRPLEDKIAKTKTFKSHEIEFGTRLAGFRRLSCMSNVSKTLLDSGSRMMMRSLLVLGVSFLLAASCQTASADYGSSGGSSGGYAVGYGSSGGSSGGYFAGGSSGGSYGLAARLRDRMAARAAYRHSYGSSGGVVSGYGSYGGSSGGSIGAYRTPSYGSPSYGSLGGASGGSSGGFFRRW